MSFDGESYLKSGSNELRVLEYRIADLSFGINILKVNRIVNTPNDFLNIPETDRAVSGVFRDRDRVVPLVDLAACLSLPVSENAHRPVLVTEFFGLLTGFLVDTLDWIHHFVWKDIIDAQAVFNGIEHQYVIGIVKPTEDRMVQLLDYETILLDMCPQLRERAMAIPEAHTDFSGRTVLVAEDSPAVRAMLSTELQAYGFKVVEAGDGALAWKLFADHPFDLVISDVEMPQMDGLALTLNIRQSDRPDTPVIVYSSIGDVGMKARASFLKADAHVTKLNLDKLMTTVERLVEQKQPPADAQPDLSEVVPVDSTVPIY